MPKRMGRRPILRLGAALALGVAIIVAAVVIPAVRADTHPLASPDSAIYGFRNFIIIPQVFIAAILFSISLLRRPGVRLLNLVSGVLGLVAFVLALFLVDAAMAFFKHGPGMRVASIALLVCIALNVLAGAIAVLVSISRFRETGRA